MTGRVSTGLDSGTTTRDTAVRQLHHGGMRNVPFTFLVGLALLSGCGGSSTDSGSDAVSDDQAKPPSSAAAATAASPPATTTATSTAVDVDCDVEPAWVDGEVGAVEQCGSDAPPDPPAGAAPFWMLGSQGDDGMTLMQGAFGLGAHDHLVPTLEGDPCAIFVLMPGDDAGDKVETEVSGDITVVKRVDLGEGMRDVVSADVAQQAVDLGIARSVYTGISFDSCTTQTGAAAG